MVTDIFYYASEMKLADGSSDFASVGSLTARSRWLNGCWGGEEGRKVAIFASGGASTQFLSAAGASCCAEH